MSTNAAVEDAAADKELATEPWWKRRKRVLASVAGVASLAAVASFIGLAIHFTTPSFNVSGLVQLANVSGPVVESNFADPCYINDGDGLHYAFATNKDKVNQPGQVHIQLSVSSDFVTWNLTDRDALPHAGNWSTNAYVWSPDVVKLDSGTYVMYYTAQSRHLHCIGAAFSDAVVGPYTPQASPIVCPLSKGGALDPEGFRDIDGKRYLVYKIDGNSFDRPHRGFRSTPIMLQELGPNGATLVGSPIQLMDRVWADGLLIEGPALGRYQTPDGQPIYVLFFSSHLFSGPGYNVKYAISSSLKGPYTRGNSPIIKTGMGPNGHLLGPGGIDIGVSSRQFVFHSIKNLTVAHGGHFVRTMWTGTLDINGMAAAFYPNAG